MPSFDGSVAMKYLEEQVAFGPRVPGSDAHQKTLAYITAALEESADRVTGRDFTLVSALTGDTTVCRNVIASFGPERKDRIFFAAHWDSRALADREGDGAKRMKPVPGANDGASGVAILLALAPLLAENPPPVGVDLLFLDGEDQGVPGDPATFCAGSQAMAAAASITGFRPAWGLVIDLVAGKRVKYYPEEHTVRLYPGLMNTVLDIVEKKLPGDVDRSR